MTSFTHPLYGPDFHQNPYPAYKERREGPPLYWDEQLHHWVLTRYDLISEILQDKRLGRDPNRHWGDSTLEQMMGRWFVFQNPPEHTRLRRVFNAAFTPKLIQSLEPRIEARVTALLDKLEGQGRMDLVRDYAYPLPVQIIADMLGVPDEDHAFLVKEANQLSSAIEKVFRHQSSPEGDEATQNLIDYFSGLIKSRSNDAQDDLISQLIADAKNHAEKVSVEELVLHFILLFFANTKIPIIDNIKIGIREIIKPE